MSFVFPQVETSDGRRRQTFFCRFVVIIGVIFIVFVITVVVVITVVDMTAVHDLIRFSAAFVVNFVSIAADVVAAAATAAAATAAATAIAADAAAAAVADSTTQALNEKFENEE